MNVWVLILTLYTNHGTVITSVPGFASVDACAMASMKWGEDVGKRFHTEASAVCVNQHEPAR